MLGLGLAAVFALAAGGASTALAHEPGELNREWKVYKACPYNNAELQELAHQGASVCFVGQTLGGSAGGRFSLGRVNVPLSKKITLQGGAAFHEGPEGNEGKIIGPENGEPVLASPELVVPGGIKYLNQAVQNEAGWPEALKTSFKEAVAKKETGLKVKIEVAGGNRLFEEKNGLSTEHLISAEGTAFELPLKVRMIGPWLSSLGGGPCTIGTEENPVVQHLTAGQSGVLKGSIGELSFNSSFTNIIISGDTLVDATWPVEAPATGCGGEYESYVDKALDIILGIPSSAGAGQTVLTGTLFSSNPAAVKEDAETGKVKV